MPGARDHLHPQDHDAQAASRRAAAPEALARPAITDTADPRLAHAGTGATADLMRVQRTAGNAAVSSLVAPSVQRAVSINEMVTNIDQAPSGEVAPEGQAQASPAGPDAGGGAEADHTITASHIGLNAPMVEASGVLRAQTVIADSVVAASYTPGAGNEW